MLKNKTLIVLSVICFGLLSLLYSCYNDETRIIKTYKEKWTIASKRPIDLDSEYFYVYSPRYWVKTPKSKTWETLRQDIDNFDYEEGYEYTIRIKIYRWHLDEGTMGTILDYECLEILSKEQKDSDVPEYEYLW